MLDVRVAIGFDPRILSSNLFFKSVKNVFTI